MILFLRRAGLWRTLLLAATMIEAGQIVRELTPEEEATLFTPPGFKRVGKPVTWSGPQSAHLQVTVRDAATHKPTPCRINVVGPDGNYYQPKSNYLTPYAMTGQWPKPGSWGNRPAKMPRRYVGRFFYSWGEAAVDVPAGTVRVEVWKGYDYRPETLLVDLAADTTKSVELTLQHAVPMAEMGYTSGDLHLHFPRVSERDEETIFDLLQAEDIHYGGVLAYNEPTPAYSGLLDRQKSPQQRGLGSGSVRKRDNYAVLSGQEYRSDTYGHLVVFMRDDLLFKGQNLNPNNWPVYGEIGSEVMAAGGYAIQAHGGYGREIYADAALGTMNATELLQFGIYRGIHLQDWYHILNTGFRFPITASSDYPACRWLGDCRTYARYAGAPNFAAWLKAAMEGKSFVTTGPLLLLEVDGRMPGERIDKNGPQTVAIQVRARCEVTPIDRVQIVVSGKAVAHLTVPVEKKTGKWVELKKTITLERSAWIAARADSTSATGHPDAESHTNPVYVYLDGKAPYNQESLDAWVEKIDAQVTVQSKREFAEKPKVLAYFQRARDRLLLIRKEGGLPAEPIPPGKINPDPLSGSHPKQKAGS